MRHFPTSYNNKYILLAMDYVSRWIEVIATLTNDGKMMFNFLCKNIYIRFSTTRAIISDEETHFCNKYFEALLSKYGVRHKRALAYHPKNK
jgi:hypothetical protein